MLAQLYEVVRQRAAQFPDAIALGSQDGNAWRTVNSRQLLACADALAGDLRARGVREGDRVITWLPGAWRTPAYLFALWKLGAIVVPLDREVNVEAVGKIIASVEPRLIIAGYGEHPAWIPDALYLEWWEPVVGGEASGEAWQLPAEDLAAIFFTSGTTGTPKGCMITHANLISQLEAVKGFVPLDPGCRLGSILPLSHLFEFTVGMLYPLFMGAAIHYIPSRRGPDIIRVLQEQRITHMNAVPQLLTAMSRSLDDQLRSRLPSYVYGPMQRIAGRLPVGWRRRLFFMVHSKLGGSLVVMSSGGAALPVEVNQFWWRLGVRVLEGYGTSECSPVVTASALDGSTPPGTVGRPLSGISVRLSPEGELLVRGPNVMRGYWKDPERTAQAIADGWYATGDLAVIDDKGNVKLSGRAKDLIVLPSGMKVWPTDIEEVLREDDVVKDASVIGVPAGAGGMTLHAYLLAQPGVYKTTVDLAALMERCNERLALHQRLASLSWWPDVDFPRTSLMKVKRHLLPLPEKVAVAAEEQAVEASDPTGQAIMTIARAEKIYRGQTLAELGLDSLGITELCVLIEKKAGKFVGEEELGAEMAVGEVIDIVARAPAAGAPGQAAARHQQKVRYVGAWPYTWGRIFRILGFPFDLLYRLVVTETIVLGKENLAPLPRRLIFAGVHHSFADVPLVRFGLARTAARRFAGRLMIAAAADGFGAAGIFASYGILALGLYPLQRGGLGDESLAQLADLAERGNAVLIFPQGMHARPAQEIAGDHSVRFRPGVTLLAREMKAGVVPFGLAGTERTMPPYLEEYHGPVIAGIPVAVHRGPLAIAFGAPLFPVADESDQAFAERLQQVCFRLTREAERALAVKDGGERVTVAKA